MNFQSLLRTFLTIAVVLPFTACEKVVDISLDTAEPRLVIDADISWEKGTDGATQRIRLSTTTDYYATEVPPVSDATVQISNAAGQRFDFVENLGTGEYLCTDFVPELHSVYELRVTAGNQTYTATERLVPAPEITRVEQRVLDIFGDNIEVRFYFNDDGATENYYLTEIQTNLLLFPSYELLDNQNTQGNELFQPFLHEDLVRGNELQIRVSGISRQFYNFMSLILAAGGGNPFSTPPANIRGNIVNQTDAGNVALGYFRLSETDTATYVVE